MSDLAPFVAAALNDKVIADLMQENAKLKAKLSKTHTIEVTGPDGTPVYALGQFEQGEHEGGGDRWGVPLQHLQECPLENLTNVVIRLGGFPLDSIAHAPCHCLDFISGCYDEDRMGLFDASGFGQVSSICDLVMRVGPFATFEDYQQVYDASDEEIFRCLHLSQAARQYPIAAVVFTHLGFHVSKIQNALNNIGIAEVSAEERAENQRSLGEWIQRRARELDYDDETKQTLQAIANRIFANVREGRDAEDSINEAVVIMSRVMFAARADNDE